MVRLSLLRAQRLSTTSQSEGVIRPWNWSATRPWSLTFRFTWRSFSWWAWILIKNVWHLSWLFHLSWCWLVWIQNLWILLMRIKLWRLWIIQRLHIRLDLLGLWQSRFDNFWLFMLKFIKSRVHFLDRLSLRNRLLNSLRLRHRPLWADLLDLLLWLFSSILGLEPLTSLLIKILKLFVDNFHLAMI